MSSIKFDVDYWTEDYEYTAFAENEYELQFNYGLDRKLAELGVLFDAPYNWRNETYKFEWFEGKVRITESRGVYTVSLNEKGYASDANYTSSDSYYDGNNRKWTFGYDENDLLVTASFKETNNEGKWSYKWSGDGLLSQIWNDRTDDAEEFDLVFGDTKNLTNVDFSMFFADIDEPMDLLMFLRLAGRGNACLLRSVDTSDWKVSYPDEPLPGYTTPGVTIHKTKTYHRCGVWNGALDYEFAREGVF